MQWPREQFGVVGDGGGSGLRLEVLVRTDGDADRPACLHDEANVGTVARVFAGQLRCSGFALPLALKAQRDNALTAEAAASVGAKFDSELIAYRRLHATPAGPRVAVRHHDLDPDETHASRLPPSLLCRHARHALRPLCPRCRGELSEPLLVPHEERRLVCPGCRESFFPKDEVKRLIARASVRQEGACDGCTQSDAACSRSAFVFNFFTARLLAFDRMDLDLADFLEERDAPELRPRHARFWDGYRPPTDPGAVLAERLAIFRAVVDGAEALDGCRLTHFDLKPRNVCLRAEGGRAEVRLIDLGFADIETAELSYLRAAQGDRRLESDYAAPELSAPGPDRLPMSAGPADANGWRVTFDPAPVGASAAFDPLLQPGDRIELTLPDGSWEGEVTRAEVVGAALRVTLKGPTAGRTPGKGFARVRRKAGPAADLFSLGMVLLEVLTGASNVGALLKHLPGVLEEFPRIPPLPPNDAPWTPGHVARVLTDLTSARALRPLYDGLEGRYGPVRAVAQELFGVALRLVFRSPHRALATYVTSRADSAGPALVRLRADLDHIEHVLAAAQARLAVARHQTDVGHLVDHLGERVGRWALARFAPAAPVPAGEPLLHALAMAARGPYADAALLRLLADFGNDPAPLTQAANRLKTASASVELGPLVEMLLLASATDAPADKPEHLRRVASRVSQWVSQQGDSQPRFRDQMRDWIVRASAVVLALDEFEAGMRPVRALTQRVIHLFATPLKREQTRPRSRPLVYRLPRALRGKFGEEEAAAGVRRVRQACRSAEAFLGDLRDRWRGALRSWEFLDRAVTVPLTTFERRIREQGEDLATAVRAWELKTTGALDALERYVADVAQKLARPWDDGLKRRWYGSPRVAVITLAPSLAGWHDGVDPLRLVDALHAGKLGPAAAVCSHLLVSELRAQKELLTT